LVSTHFRIETGNPGGGVSECPQRMRVYSGGALWHEPGEPPDPALAAQLRTSSSAPAPGRRGWYADGYNFTGAELRLEVVAMCLPKRRIGHVTRVLETRTPPNSAGRGARSGCPKGTRVITGGAYWHPPGEFADPAQAAGTLISSSAPVRRGHAWYADGVNFIGPIDYKLTVVAVCAPA
jgi:hypothetical protein